MDRKIFRTKVIPLFTVSIILTFVSSFIGFQYINIISNIVIFVILAIATMVIFIIILIWQQENLFLLFFFNLLGGLTLTPLIYLANITDPHTYSRSFWNYICSIFNFFLTGLDYQEKSFTF